MDEMLIKYGTEIVESYGELPELRDKSLVTHLLQLGTIALYLHYADMFQMNTSTRSLGKINIRNKLSGPDQYHTRLHQLN